MAEAKARDQAPACHSSASEHRLRWWKLCNNQTNNNFNNFPSLQWIIDLKGRLSITEATWESTQLNMALVFSPAVNMTLPSRPTDLAANVQDNIHMEDILSTEKSNPWPQHSKRSSQATSLAQLQ